MVYFPLLFIYVLCCFGIGYLGRHTRAGFVAVTLLSVLLTPIVMLRAILLLRSTEEVFVTRDDERIEVAHKD